MEGKLKASSMRAHPAQPDAMCFTQRVQSSEHPEIPPIISTVEKEGCGNDLQCVPQSLVW